MISLFSFIQTGRLGAIGLDSTREDVEAAFGSPPTWDAESQPENAKIWKYGAMEIYFDEHRVWMIFSDNFCAELHMGDIAFDSSGISGHMNRSDVEAWLSVNSVEFRHESFPWCEEGVQFQTASGVTLTLCAENKGEIAFLNSLALVRR